jgi:hypothetical protein
MPVPMANTLWIKNNVLGRESDHLGQNLVRTRQMSNRRSSVSAWPFVSNAMTITAAPYKRAFFACSIKASSPSFMLIEFTTHLPCTHFRPASITLPFGGIDDDRNPADIRFGRHQVQERGHQGLGVEQALVEVDVEICAPFSTCFRHVEGLVEFVVLDQAQEFARAGDVAALADVDEVGFRTNDKRLESR